MTSTPTQILSDAQRTYLRHLLRTQNLVAESDATPGLSRVEDRDSLPLSHAQERLWFLSQLDPASAAYNVPCCLRLRGSLDIAALRRTLDEIVRRHEILRTRLVERPGGVVQQVDAPAAVPIPIVDVSGCANPDAVAQRLVEREARRPFDLARGSLLRVRLVRIAAGHHLSLLVTHHVVCDGVSVGILVRELSELYQAFSAGTEPRLTTPTLQYGDYAAWQRQTMPAPRIQQQLDYWRMRLAGLKPWELPADRTRAEAAAGYRAGRVLFEVPQSVTDRLREISQASGTSLFMLLSAGLQLLLSRYSGHRDIAIGTVVGNRPHRELDSLIGFFVNALVLRTHARDDMTVGELLQTVRETTLDAFANLDVPFERVVEELVPDRQSGRSPLFQVLFTFQNTASRRIEMPGVEVTLNPVSVGHAKYELNLSISDSGRELYGFLEYAADLFDESSMVRLLGRLWTLLDRALSNLGQRIGELELLSDEERHHLIRSWSTTERPFADARHVHEMFALQAARRPDAIALVCEDQQVSYATLARRGEQLARYLRSRGIGLESRVVLCLDRSLDLVIAMLGVLQAGGAYVPLDPDLPASRIQQLIAETNPSLVMTISARPVTLPDAYPVLELDRARLGEMAGEIAAASEDDRAGTLRIDDDNLAYVIPTSGSTGRPKAVGITHGGLANHMRWLCDEFGITEDDVFLQKTSASFDASVFEFYAPLYSGGRLVLAAPGEHRDPERMVDRLRQSQATMTQFVPSVLTEITQVSGFDACHSLRLLFVGGEAFPRKLHEQVLMRRPVRQANMYGPTEVTIVSASWSEDRLPAASIDVPIGRPIANLQTFVVDDGGRLAPPGVPGELYLGGAGLGRGYLGQPARTAERFVPDGITGTPGARLYRTGDRVRWHAEGVLEFLGRVDQQIKLRGYRIELGEIEAVLGRLPGVQQCAVALRPDAHAQPRLVAYVTLDDATTPLTTWAARWRVALLARLPEYMVPVSFVPLRHWPLTPNGKLDRAALPAPEDAALPAAAPAARPQPGLETLIAEIWAQVLPHAAIGRTDNFFELGGHSLLATQVMSRVRAACNVDLPLRTLFERPTVAGLAAAVHQTRTPYAPPPPITPAPRSADGLPLSYAQQRLWFLAQLDPRSPAYTIPYALRLRGPLDEHALARALRALVARHEILRTRFVDHDGTPRQHVDPTPRVALRVIDLRSLPEVDREEAAHRIVTAEANHVFVLSDAPLLRGHLIRLADDERLLLITVHHVVSDGWSLAILIRELRALYDACCANLPSPLSDLEIQYADFAVWQRQWLTGDVLEAQLAYWRTQLAALPPLALPTDHPRPARASHRTGVRRFAWDATLTNDLLTLSRREGVTLFMTLLAGLATVLARWTGQRDLAIGTDVANRHLLETESLIGFFVNQLVLRLRLDPTASFRDLLAHVRQVALDAYTHQDVPFDRVVSALAPDRDLARAPLFQVALVLQNAPVEALQLGEARIEPLLTDTGAAETDLTLIVRESNGGLSGTLQYATDLIERTTAERFIRQFETLVRHAAARVDAPIGTLTLLDAPESARTLALGIGPSAAYDDPACLHDMVAAWANRTPHAVALTHAGEHVTYGELRRRARHLAAFLVREGAGPNKRVAVCLQRSPDLIVALLGILYAGAAYVPLDPEYPEERLAFMCDDAKPILLLVNTLSAGRVSRVRTRIMYLDREWPAIARAPRARRALPHVDGDALAYVTYTSGSTGLPKGAMNTHRAVRNRLASVRETIGINRRDRMLLKTSITFDVSVGECFGTLASGACLVLAAPGGHRDPDYLSNVIATERITLVHFVPSMLDAFLQVVQLGDCASVRALLCSGEALTPSVVRHAKTRFAADIYNLYGPTETAIEVTTWKSEGRAAAPDRVSLGRPIANVRLYVLDAADVPQPVGVPGELWIGGIAVGRGYLNQPALTADRFRPDPHAAAAGALRYRTGDLARWRADGELEYLGRRDRQLKIRGFRVEPGEIEAVLRAQPNVRQAALVLREDDPGRPELVAYVVASPAGTADDRIAVWLEALRARLPDYMIPSALVVMDALPVLPSGKLDSHALPAPERPRTNAAADLPRTSAERLLSQIWKDLLRLEAVGIHDNFFALGGDSILSVQMVSRARQQGLTFTVRDIFEHQSIATLAAVARPTITVRATPDAMGTAALLTPMQQWLIEQSPVAPHHHNQAVCLRPGFEITPAVVRRAFHSLLLHHDALRMRLTNDAGTWMQTVSPPTAIVPFCHLDLSDLPTSIQAAAMHRAARSLQASLNLSDGPLVRVAWFTTTLQSPERLLLILHHAIVDGLSWRILLDDFDQACRDILAGRDVGLPLKTTSFIEWARAVAAHASSPAVRRERAYWREQLGSAGAAAPPRDFPEGANTVGSMAVVSFTIDPEESAAAATRSASASRVTIEDLLLAALARSCGIHGGVDEAVIEVEGHGREEAISGLDVSRTVGLFTISYPIKLPASAMSPARLLRSVVERRAAVPGRGTGFGAWRYLSGDGAFVEHACAHRAEISFNYLGQLDAVLDTSRLLSPLDANAGPMQCEDELRPHVLHVSAHMSGGALHCAIAYSTNQYERETIARLANTYAQVIRALAAARPNVTQDEPAPIDPLHGAINLDEILASVRVQTD